jgi:hypothetical protein
MGMIKVFFFGFIGAVLCFQAIARYYITPVNSAENNNEQCTTKDTVRDITHAFFKGTTIDNLQALFVLEDVLSVVIEKQELGNVPSRAIVALKDNRTFLLKPEDGYRLMDLLKSN